MTQTVKDVQIKSAQSSPLLTDAALAFLATLHREFDSRRRDLLAARKTRSPAFDFLPSTALVRAGDWKIAATPPDLQDRRVEITGPTDAKMVINALNCGASVFMADFEDATAPAWGNLVHGQEALHAAVR